MFPEEIREDLADALARLDLGVSLSMPLSRPMPSIGKGVHELRLKDASGIYRIIYFLWEKERIYLLHAFKKKSQKTLKANLDLAKRRLKGVLR
ncbi:MAG: type II toxin-antitoxin system RelE/ParE family toxin [Deltaproteobacteria bacterium]|nr:type II toxin-antitoxin system RelE/ParE family toxin [Deltaproteobacteria bacterium]